MHPVNQHKTRRTKRIQNKRGAASQRRKLLAEKLEDRRVLASLLQTIDPPAVGFGDGSFGSGVATNATYHIVGANRVDTSAGSDAGEAYVFDATNGTLLHTLNSPSAAANDQLGESVAIDGSTAVVGARFASAGGNNQVGRVSVFDASTGGSVLEIANPTPAANEYFGAAVAISSGVIAVGAPEVSVGGASSAGEVYLFNASSGALLHTIPNPAPSNNDYFGGALALDGNTLVIGSDISEVVYIYDASSGSLDHTIPEAGTGYTSFGASVAVSGNNVLIGSHNDSGTGKAYLYSAATGGLQQTLSNPFPDAGDYFGRSVAISGSSVIVGAPRDDAGATNSGSVYEFDATTGALVSTLNNPTPNSSDEFGSDVAINGDIVLTGVPADDTLGSSKGIAHVFTIGPPPYAVALSSTNIDENSAADSVIGLLTGTPANNPPYTFALIPGTGSQDNGQFTIVGDELRAVTGFDFESQTSYSILVEGENANGVKAEANFTINVNDLNEAPTAILISSSEVDEFQAVGTVVGQLTAADVDAGDSQTYSLVVGAGSDDNASFSILGDQLQTAESFDFESRSEYSVRIRAEDASGLFTEEAFAISVANVNPLLPNAVPQFDLRLVADIDDTNASSNPGDVVTIGSQAFFTADSLTTGRELYRTDGTTGGTHLVKDLLIGDYSGDPRSLTEYNGELFFLTEFSYIDPLAPPEGEPETRTGLWKSDGSEAGTTLVKDFGMSMAAPAGESTAMQVVNGKLLFFAGDPTTMEELWSSDGTEAGTEMLTSFFPSAGGIAIPGEMPTAFLGNVLLFNRDVDSAMGSHSLWRTDGTVAGTYELRMGEMGFGFLELDPSLTVVGSEVFFSSTSFNEGKELWKTDGTVARTNMVKDIHVGPDDSGPTNFTEVNGTLFFSAEIMSPDPMNPGTGRELWKSDGTSAGTVLVKDIAPNDFSSIDPYSGGFVSFNNTLYFSANDNTNGGELWKSDGTAAGTTMVLDITPAGVGLYPNNLIVRGSELMFTTASFSPDGVQLWKSDGTAVGTQLVADLDGPGSSSAQIYDPQVSGSNLFFRGNTPTDGIELWVSDGTTAGTIQLADLNPGSGNGVTSIFTTGLGGVLFAANDASSGNELGVSDGTTQGTQLIDVAAGTPSADIRTLFEHQGTIYFDAENALWSTDGTTSGTQMLNSVAPSFLGYGFTAVGDEVFFYGEGDSSDGEELWKTDGTSAGTVLVKDINVGSGNSEIERGVSFDGVFFFVADDGINGAELWRSTGVGETTTLWQQFGAGAADGEIDNIKVVGDTMYVVANDVLYATSSVSTPMTAIHSDVRFNTLMPWDDILYFAGQSAAHGHELWRTDGSALGTYLVADIAPGPASSFPGGGVATTETGVTAGGDALEAKLVFRALTASGESQLFSTDGSTAGTVQLTSEPISPTGHSFTPVSLTRADDQIYFEGFDETNGRELWVTNGTVAGTRLVEDLRPGPSPNPEIPPEETFSTALFNLKELTAFRDRLFFRTSEDASGSELWSSDGSVDGTGLAIDIFAGAESGTPTNFVSLDNDLYLTANTLEYGIADFATRSGEVFRLNEAPYAYPLAAITNVDTPVDIRLSALDADSDSLTFEVVDAPANGTTSIVGGVLTYTPAAGTTGEDQLTYRTYDGSLYSQPATVIVNVDSSANTVSFALASETITEQDGIHRVNVLLSQAAATELLIPYLVEGADAIASGNPREGTLFIPAGATSGEIVIAIDDDERYETGPQQIEVTLPGNTAVALGGIAQHVLEIQDNDSIPTLSFTTPWQSVSESDDTLAIRVGLSAASDEIVSANVGFSGSATRNVDYIADLTYPVVFQPGEVSQTVLVRLVDDGIAESREQIFAQLEGPVVGANVTSNPDEFRHLIWIDDVDTSVVSLTPAVLLQTEGDVVTLEATRSGGNLAASLSIPTIVSQGGSTASDYSLSSTTFDFAANETTATIDVTITEDGTSELFESLTVRLDDTGGTFAPGDGTSTYIGIYDNDQTTISLSIGDTNGSGVSGVNSLRETYPHGGGLNWLIDVTATLSAPLSTSLSVPFVVSDDVISGYAKPGVDFILSDADFVFPAGTTEVTRQLEIISDIEPELDEQIRFALEPTASQFFLRSTGIIDNGSLSQEFTIRDDDSAVSISAPSRVNENAGQLTFEVSLDEPSDRFQTQQFVIAGSARRYVDYNVASRTVDVTFLQGEQTKQVVVDLIDDNIDGPNKSITLTHQQVFNGELSYGVSRTVKIIDNEAAPVVSFEITNLTARENGSTVIGFELNRTSSFPIELEFKFSGSAKRGQHYEILGSSQPLRGNKITIPPLSNRGYISIRTLSVNSDKTLTMKFVGGKKVNLPRARTAKLTIRNQKPFLRIPAPRRDEVKNIANIPPGTLAIDVNPSLGSDLQISDAFVGSVSNSSDFQYLPGQLAISDGSQGLLENATVFFDANFNFVRDFLDLDQDGIQDPDEPTEPQSQTALDGTVAFTIPEAFDIDASGIVESNEGRLVLTGGIDTSTSLPWTIPLTTPAGSFIVNPINTLIENVSRRHPLTIQQTWAAVGDALGIAGYDFVAGNAIYEILSGDALSASAYLQQVQISSATIQIAALASSASGLSMAQHADEIYDLLGDQLATDGTTLDFSNEGLVRELILSVSSRLSTPLASSVVDGSAELIALGAAEIQSLRLPDFATPEDFLVEVTKTKQLMHGEIATAFSEVGSGTRTITSVLADYTNATAPNFASKVSTQVVGQIIPTVIGVSNAAVFEGDSGQQTLNFIVAIKGEHDSPVSVDYSMFDDSASDGIDYTSSSGTLTWAVGDSAPKTISVPVNGDADYEADEEFRVLLSNAQNGVIRINEGIGFIINDEALSHTATANPGVASELTVIHSSETFELLENDTEIAAGSFANELNATIGGQATEANDFIVEFAEATYRGDHYSFSGGNQADATQLRGGRFTDILHVITDAANAIGTTTLTSDVGPEVVVDHTSVESTAAFVTLVQDLRIELPLEVTEVEISDPDPTVDGTMRISSPSSQFAPFDFTVPESSITIVTANPAASVQSTSTDPQFTGTTTHLALSAATDSGDAPAPYPTLLADDGATHTELPGFHLGASWDADSDGLPSPSADGDDVGGIDDEDGVSFGSLKVGDLAATIDVVVTNTAAVTSPYLDAWIDFNADGDWDDVGEHITSGVVTDGAETLVFAVPESAVAGETFARFRLHSGTTGLLPTGAAATGEVEDYAITISDDVILQLPEVSANSVIVRQNGSRIEVYDVNAASLIFDTPSAQVNKLTIIGSDSQPDTVNVDASSGGFFSLPDGIHLMGGQGVGDAITVTGTTLTQANYFTLMSPVGIPALQLLDGNETLDVSFDQFDDQSFTDLLTFTSSAAAMSVGSGTTFINSQTPVNLGGLTTISGGSLTATNTIALGSGESIIGHGSIAGQFAAELGSLVRATGDLSIGDAASQAGFITQGQLDIGEHTITLHDAGQAVLGSLTELGTAGSDGTLMAVGGLLIDFGNNVVGYGDLITPNDANDLVMLNGLVQGNSATEQITLQGYVKGVGSMDHASVTGTYSPGFSPAQVINGSVNYAANADIVLELGGTTPGSSGHDQLVHTGDAQIGGDLTVELINGYTPQLGDSLVLMTATGGVTGEFDSVSLPPAPLGSDWNLVVDANEVRIEVVDLVDVMLTTIGSPATPSILVNQRSQITELNVSFDGDVDVDTDAFMIVQRGATGGEVAHSFMSAQDINGDTNVVIKFDAASTFTRGIENALVDGNYQITIDPTKVRRAGTSVGLDGNADGLQGGDFVLGDEATDNFFAMYGDTRGLRAVGAFDFNQFRKTFGKADGQTGYEEAFDYRGVDAVGAFEFNQFRKNFGKLLDWE